MAATLKKKLAADDEDADEQLEKHRKKGRQSEFMRQLTDIAQQAAEPPPQIIVEEAKLPVRMFL